MKSKGGIKIYYDEEEEIEEENENERYRLSEINKIKYNKSSSNKEIGKKYFWITILAIFILLFVLSATVFIIIKMIKRINNRKENLNKEIFRILNISNPQNNIINDANKITITNNIINITNNEIINNMFTNDTNNITNNNQNKKIGLAFIYSTLYSNGIARFISLTANYLMKTGRYDISFIISKTYSKEYTYNSSIKRFTAEHNFTLIRNITKYANIDIFIVQNLISPPAVNFYHSIGKKVIGMFHGVFMSAMTMSSVSGYKNWINFDLFDSYIFIAADDYFFYKKLGFKNELYIPNLCPFEPSENKDSNLTYNNIIMLGRQNDEYKGARYAIKTMSLVIKEVPDAKLYLVTSDSRVQFLRDIIKDLNLTNNVFIHSHTYNISSYFWNSSIHMYTSLSEAYPMAMNEGKAHGMPIVAFDVPYSPPYQDGVIVVDQLDCEGLARETIKLLKDYNYRKRMGEFAKRSLNKYPNEEILNLWERLFKALLSEDKNEYRNLQFEVEMKYYKEEIARTHLQKSFDSILKRFKNMTCHHLDNFTDINYIKNIKDCNITNNNTSRN